MSTSSLSKENLILILLVSFFHLSYTGPANVYQVSGVVGGMAQLPCNITIPNKDDSIRLILWFRDNVKGGPIYSIDTRKSDLLKGKHFSSYESISLRASFDLNTNPAYLILDPLREEDISEYKCRVDFDKGRTLTTIVRLTVIVPPTNVFITNSLDQVVESVAGPYDGGSNVELNCVSKGGVPLPSLTWYMNGEPIDDMYFSIEENKTVINQLTIFNVSRDHLKSVLMCTATNALYPSSFNATITLDLNLMPTYVKILPIKKSLVSGRSVDIVCESMYSRPPAVLTWIKNKRKLLDEREIIAENGNKTTSVLNLVPSPDDDGSYLICKAENIRLKNSVIEDRVQLSVYYSPVMTVYPISNNPSSIKEDGSVKLQCRAKSNPPVIEYSWYFDGKMISTSQTKYKWVNQSVLSIDQVERIDNGKYKCSGKNKIGYGESPEYTLKVNYSPICEPNQKTVYGVGLRETVRILCVVQAMPVEATFHWTMNGSQLPLHIKYPTNVEGLRSSLMYTPFTRQDYGSLQCWARNEAGSQEKPCTFHIVPADYPEPPTNCSVSRVSDISMEIDCEPGYDGGLSQIFHLMVYRNDRSLSNLVYNLSSIDRPHFILHHLLPESYYFLDVYSSNIRGKSRDMSLLTSTTLTSEQLSLGKHQQAREEKNISMYRIALVTSILVIVSCILLSIISRMRSKSRKSLSKRKVQFHSYSPKIKQSASQQSLGATSPDIIPLPRESLETGTVEMYWNTESASKNCLTLGDTQIIQHPPAQCVIFYPEKPDLPGIEISLHNYPYTTIYDYSKDHGDEIIQSDELFMPGTMNSRHQAGQ